MISNVRHFFSCLFLLACAGCGAGQGSPCKEKNDCESGLLCCPTNRLSATVRGTCQKVCGATTDIDAGTTEDASVDDSGEDVALDATGAQSDSGSIDSGQDANNLLSDAMTEGG